MRQEYNELYDHLNLAGKADREEFIIKASRIAVEKRSSMIVVVLFFAAMAAMIALVEEIRISRRGTEIAKIKRELAIGTEDSIQFNCRRCGWEHELHVKDTSIYTKK